jgi:hypothetical protein
MKLFTQKELEQLIRNGSPENYGKDHIPVVKLFLPGTAFTWLLTDVDWEYQNIAFGLCDLGMNCPELGSVDLDELQSVRNPFRVERDYYFEGKYPISVYARAAYRYGAITEDRELLLEALSK